MFKGRDLTTMTETELRKEIRWKEISWIAQNAMNALDPVYRVGSLMVEVIRTHTDKSKREAVDRVDELLREVGLDPAIERRVERPTLA
jgi:peptide/nickel transport system ATP-binding protein